MRNLFNSALLDGILDSKAKGPHLGTDLFIRVPELLESDKTSPTVKKLWTS
jgi:hypothetical protein